MGDVPHVIRTDFHELVKLAQLVRDIFVFLREREGHLRLEADRREALAHRVVEFLREAEAFLADLQFGVKLAGVIHVAENLDAPQG